jgi:uncharacterized protein (TIRG00374 family)
VRVTLRQLIQLSISLAIALGIFWYVYQDLEGSQLSSALSEVSLFWIGVSVLLSLVGYWLRAWRWKLLIDATDSNKPTLLTAFWALMFGYVVNLLLPRAGEIARCAALKNTNRLSVGSLLGTVVLERTIDFAFMLCFVLLAFMLEARIFLEMMDNLFSWQQVLHLLSEYGLILLTVTLILGVTLASILRRIQGSAFMSKLQGFFRQFVKGIKSIANLENAVSFWVSSLFIWIIYYAMMYFITWSMAGTSSLSASSILMVLVMGSIGMVAPVQGGIGTFHALVAFILVFYGIPESEGKVFALIVHSSQVATVLILGLVSVVMLGKLTWKNKPGLGSLRKDV